MPKNIEEKDTAEPSDDSVSIGEAQCDGWDVWSCPWYRCPQCEKNQIAPWFNFCPNCGAKLQWQD